MITADQLVAHAIGEVVARASNRNSEEIPYRQEALMTNPRQRLYPNLRRGAVAVKTAAKQQKHRAGGRCEVQALAQGIIEDPVVQATLLNQAQRGKLAPAVMSLLFYYAYGKPKETVALEGGLEVLTIRIVDEYADPDDARGSDPAPKRSGS